MKRLMLLLVISLISTNVACTLCSDCDDYTYGAFGGRWERSDMTNGRVGTAFSTDGPIVSDGEATSAQDPGSAAPEIVEELEKPHADDEQPLDSAPTNERPSEPDDELLDT